MACHYASRSYKKERKIKPKANRRKEMMKIRIEIKQI
jgi:hypothetical protein